MSKTLLLSTVVVTFILGIGTGFILSPEYANKMTAKKTVMVELGRADKLIDLRYLDGVIAHHLNAIFMARQAEANSQRKEIRDLAKEIIIADEKGIQELYEWKKSWFNNKQITIYEKINLGAYDDKFDLRFLNALIAHHEEAIMTAKEIRTKSQRNEILNLADSIIQNLSSGIDTLTEWRNNWYQSK
ncbi:MAG: hypothetical protein UW64_C0019G0014 [Microgenomates group bacterium GW2011_GWC1_44_37]|nr:MAG: hypothetical protein UW64_C0019G0014 [Microgenomates group bacterium GW2011_GWC1_44_37]